MQGLEFQVMGRQGNRNSEGLRDQELGFKVWRLEF